jgi:hypothetical protein
MAFLKSKVHIVHADCLAAAAVATVTAAKTVYLHQSVSSMLSCSQSTRELTGCASGSPYLGGSCAEFKSLLSKICLTRLEPKRKP